MKSGRVALLILLAFGVLLTPLTVEAQQSGKVAAMHKSIVLIAMLA